MNDKIEAIKEAIGFIKDMWLGTDKPVWEGRATDFVGATLDQAVTIEDVQTIVEAYKSGEWTPVQNIDGDIEDGHLVRIRVWK